MALIFPHEFIAKTAIHSIQAAVARELVNLGMTQREIADLMDSQTSTVSQYIGGQRGSSYALSEDSMNLVNMVAESVYDEPTAELLQFGVSQVCNHVIEEEYGYKFEENDASDA